MAINSGAISAIPVEIFAAYIVEKLRKTNPHLQFATDESSFVLDGSVVHIPQAGNSPSVVKNRKNFPATAVQRGDSFVTYPLDVYSTDPTHVTWHEAHEISYDKTDSVLNDHVATLIEAVGDNVIFSWVRGLKPSGSSFVADNVPAASIIRTSGAPADVNPNDGQTGQRQGFSYKDLQKAQAMMNKGGVPKEERYAMIESYQYQQFLDSLSTNQMAAFQATADLANGIVGRFAGFQILERSSVLAFTTAGVLRVPGEALSATDNLGSLCWQKASVAKAMGDIKPFQTVDDPTYYGDIFSALVKFGGRCRRADWKGLIAIVQDVVPDPEG
ncbi:MAG: hypothetical protein LBC49_04900 [Bacteroidales bacterium]|jgi:hypothetical protein|nr:hypothetical protein [Bacteroidales bacterium]